MRCFVTGTDTGVGKTACSAALVKAAGKFGPALYWKPVQTGDDDDTATVRRLSGLSAANAHAPAYHFLAPISPHLAAEREGAAIRLERLLERYREISSEKGSLVVEGAGGLLVPLHERTLQADLIACLELPVVLICHDRVGAMNHTLLTVESLRARRIPLLGIVWNRATDDFGNRQTIERLTGVRTLAHVPETARVEEAVELLSIARDIRDLFSTSKD